MSRPLLEAGYIGCRACLYLGVGPSHIKQDRSGYDGVIMDLLLVNCVIVSADYGAVVSCSENY